MNNVTTQLQPYSSDIDYLDEYILPIAEESHMASFIDCLLAGHKVVHMPQIYESINN